MPKLNPFMIGTLIVWILILGIIAAGVHHCYGYEVSLGAGQEFISLDGDIMQVEISNRVTPHWYGSLVLDGLGSGSDQALIISSRLGVQTPLIGAIHGGFFGGFGLRAGSVPGIGVSHVTGHFGFWLKMVMTNWDVGVESWHMSDPLQAHDKGWNVALITITRRF